MPQRDTVSSPDNRQSIRRQMRQRRRALTPRQQEQAARDLDKLLRRQPLFQRSRRIAFYLPEDGEMDPRPLLHTALNRGKRCYLPVLHPCQKGKLWFLPYTERTPLVTNRFGIPEPAVATGRRIPPRELDLVLLPLVAFDRLGGRLGMGAGFYDRTFEFKTGDRRRNPLLVGLAHSCQEVERVALQPWDIPLGAVVTESGIGVCHSKLGTRDFLERDLLMIDRQDRDR